MCPPHPTMANAQAAIPVFSSMSYITTGDPFADAYSGHRKVEQAATEEKTPFASGLIAASRHRGMQFKNSPQKHGKGMPSTNVGDPYLDGFKRAHRHYQRAGETIPGPDQFKPTSLPAKDLPTSIRASGVIGSGSTNITFGGAIPHAADRGATVAVPTREMEQYPSYQDAGSKKRTALQSRRVPRQVRRGLCPSPTPTHATTVGVVVRLQCEQLPILLVPSALAPRSSRLAQEGVAKQDQLVDRDGWRTHSDRSRCGESDPTTDMA